MKRRLAVRVTIVAAVAGSVAAALALATRLWNRETARYIDRLYARIDPKAPPFSRDDLANLPDPVVRYFEFALTAGQPIVQNARFRQTGEFAMRPNAWSPFSATEYFSVEPPGFLWNARITMAKVASFYIRDGYNAGEGAMYGTLAAIVPVVNQSGTSAMASGELLRYVAEAVWFPTALLPRGGISWAPVDDNNARVTLRDGATTVSCDVRFDKSGAIVRISAMRGRDVAGRIELTQWVGHWRDYRRSNGMMIPMSADVEWALPGGPFPYWRGRILDAEYQFAAPLRS